MMDVLVAVLSLVFSPSFGGCSPSWDGGAYYLDCSSDRATIHYTPARFEVGITAPRPLPTGDMK